MGRPSLLIAVCRLSPPSRWENRGKKTGGGASDGRGQAAVAALQSKAQGSPAEGLRGQVLGPAAGRAGDGRWRRRILRRDLRPAPVATEVRAEGTEPVGPAVSDIDLAHPMPGASAPRSLCMTVMPENSFRLSFCTSWYNGGLIGHRDVTCQGGCCSSPRNPSGGPPRGRGRGSGRPNRRRLSSSLQDSPWRPVPRRRRPDDG